MQVDNLFLEKELGKGAFGEVYLTRIDNDTNYYATKVYDRESIEKSPDLFRYLKTEATILKNLNHPNIVKLKEVKKTKKHFYLVTELCNGGELSKALKQYKEKYNKPFTEEIVQYLMRQIIDGINYLHSKNIMHRDIKLDNILLNYDNEDDKKNLNIMKAQVKIIDFGFAIYLNNKLGISIVGSPQNMDPIILKKLTSNGKLRKLGYDSKVDIWSLGSICYEMLIGKAVFDAEDIDELVYLIEKGDYKVPSNLSKEVVSFLNGMLQYDSTIRLNSAQLLHHRFLTENTKNFHKIDLSQVSGKVDNKDLTINVKGNKNQTIWAIFNEEDAKKLTNISPAQLEKNPKDNNPMIQPKNSVIPTASTKSVGEMPIKSFKTHDNINYPNMVDINYKNQEDNPNYGPLLPRRDSNPIYVNQKFENEINYTFSGGIFDV
jgi:serine/threonine protein kinase